MHTSSISARLLAGLAVTGVSASAVGDDLRLNTSPVVVSATRVEQASFDLPVSIDVIAGDEIRDSRPLVNLTETAVRVPGVVVSNRYNAAQDLAVSSRGFGSRSSFGVRGVRIYADGIPVTMPDGQGQTGTFNLDSARSIEFMRGPFSALYGNSSGGVIQIFTRDGGPEPSFEGTVSGGSYDTRRTSIGFDGQRGALNYVANANQYDSDGYRDHSASHRDSQHAKLGYVLGDSRLTMVATALDQTAEDPGALTAAQYQDNPQQAGTNAISRNARVNRNHKQGGATFEHALSGSDRLALMGYYGTRVNEQYQTLGATGRLSAIDREFLGSEAKWTHIGEILGRPVTVVAGLNYDRMVDDRTQFNAVNGEKSGIATRFETQRAHNLDEFAQVMIAPSPDWLLIAGIRHTDVRFDIHDHIPSPTDGSGHLAFSNTSPVIGATYHVTPAFNLYANFGRGFETPTFIEQTYVGDPTINDGAGPNLALQPSRSRNYEAGTKVMLTSNTRLNLATFRIDTRDEIVTDQGNGATASFKNVGRTRRDGVELALDSALPFNLNLYVAVARMTATFRDTFCTGSPPCATVSAGNRIPGTYAYTGYAELAWHHPASGFSAAIEGVRFSDTYTNDSNAQRADGYTLANLRAGFRQRFAHWQTWQYLRLENLGDKTYISSVRINTSQATTGAAFEPGAGRNWFAGVGARYIF